MIISIGSSLPTFKGIKFHEGLNILVADSAPGASAGRTRNSAGKTSFVEVIHFLLGADCDPNSIFRSPELIEHSFSMTLVLRGERFVVQRSGSSPSKIFIDEGGRDRNDILLKLDKSSERYFIPNEKWKDFLGGEQFGLPHDPLGTAFDEAFTPSYRSMLSYFARRQNSGGMLAPERQAEKQQRWDWQVNLSYLFGLDWRIAYEFQKVRARERSLEELRKAAKGGALGDVFGTVAALRPQLAITTAKAEKLRAQLRDFEVHDSYRELTRRAARAKTEMQNLSHHTVSLRENLNYLEEALKSESMPAKESISRIYEAVGVELPDIALRRFEDVEVFYSSVIANRRSHLQREISDAERQISDAEFHMRALSYERRQIIQDLEGKGALDDFMRAQKELSELDAAVAVLTEKYKSAEILEGESSKLDLDRANLRIRLQSDHQQRKDALDAAILVVADVISELYDDRSGRFVIDATDNGPDFRISIEGDRGGGISKIEIFCFDMALFKVSSHRYGGPGFLVHDSHLFDGVDERQVATALVIGQRFAEAEGLQYVVTMNSDVFQRLPLPESFASDDFVLPVRLSDSEHGGLFGFRFG